jgi:hypothetical protein
VTATEITHKPAGSVLRRAVSPWRPMKSAPLDGTPVLLTCGGHIVVGQCDPALGWVMHEIGFRAFESLHPSAWAELPPLPE